MNTLESILIALCYDYSVFCRNLFLTKDNVNSHLVLDSACYLLKRPIMKLSKQVGTRFIDCLSNLQSIVQPLSCHTRRHPRLEFREFGHWLQDLRRRHF